MSDEMMSGDGAISALADMLFPVTHENRSRCRDMLRLAIEDKIGAAINALQLTAPEAGRDASHCRDCCCAQLWKALGIMKNTGKSLVEHVAELRAQAERPVDYEAAAIVMWSSVTPWEEAKSAWDQFPAAKRGVLVERAKRIVDAALAREVTDPSVPTRAERLDVTSVVGEEITAALNRGEDPTGQTGPGPLPCQHPHVTGGFCHVCGLGGFIQDRVPTPEPAGERYRVGRKVGRTIYETGPNGDSLIGIMDNATDARKVVGALNLAENIPEVTLQARSRPVWTRERLIATLTPLLYPEDCVGDWLHAGRHDEAHLAIARIATAILRGMK